MQKIISIILISFILIAGIIIVFQADNIRKLKLFVITSGSMEPQISTGSVVLTKNIHPDRLQAGDIITFSSPNNTHEYVTHRITEVSKQNSLVVLKTKGDNNNSVDPWLVAGGAVAGKTILTIPHLGFLFSFTQTWLGILLFIIIPSLFIIFYELRSLIGFLKLQTKPKNFPNLLPMLPFLWIGLLMLNVDASPALLSDSTFLKKNIVIAETKKNSDDQGEDEDNDEDNNDQGEDGE